VDIRAAVGPVDAETGDFEVPGFAGGVDAQRGSGLDGAEPSAVLSVRVGFDEGAQTGERDRAVVVDGVYIGAFDDDFFRRPRAGFGRAGIEKVFEPREIVCAVCLGAEARGYYPDPDGPDARLAESAEFDGDVFQEDGGLGVVTGRVDAQRIELGAPTRTGPGGFDPRAEDLRTEALDGPGLRTAGKRRDGYRNEDNR